MKITDQSYEIIALDSDWFKESIYKICKGYCECYNKPMPKTFEDMYNYVKKWRKHGSPLEHGHMSVEFTTNLGVANELVRHRHTAYSQQSTRYCNYSLDRFDNGLTFILDSSVKDSDQLLDIWLKGRKADEKEYLTRLSLGQTPEQARGCLPKDLLTKILVTANLREWHSIFELRTSVRAHYQMRELMIPLLMDVQEKIPCIFDDIVVEENYNVF